MHNSGVVMPVAANAMPVAAVHLWHWQDQEGQRFLQLFKLKIREIVEYSYPFSH